MDQQMCENCTTDFDEEDVEECVECGYLYCGNCSHPEDHDCEP